MALRLQLPSGGFGLGSTAGTTTSGAGTTTAAGTGFGLGGGTGTPASGFSVGGTSGTPGAGFGLAGTSASTTQSGFTLGGATTGNVLNIYEFLIPFMH